MIIFGAYGEFEVDPLTGEVQSPLPHEYRYVRLVDVETLKPHLIDGRIDLDILLIGYLYENDDGKVGYDPPEVGYQQWLADVGALMNGAGVMAGAGSFSDFINPKATA